MPKLSAALDRAHLPHHRLDAARVLEPADAAVAAARLRALEAREQACWSFAAAAKATPRPPCVALMEESEQFDGAEVELHDGRLALRWGPGPGQARAGGQGLGGAGGGGRRHGLLLSASAFVVTITQSVIKNFAVSDSMKF